MHQLLLLRHAKSSWDDAKLPDRDRPLNKRGRRAAAAMRGAMHDLGLSPDVVLVSAARRTQETLAALEPWDDTPLIETLDSLYLASAGQMLAILQGVNETVRSLMVIGHNPGMHELAVLLSGAPPHRRLSDRSPGRVRHRRSMVATRRRRRPAGAFRHAA
jgi:phosphohistidine phosphatase